MTESAAITPREFGALLLAASSTGVVAAAAEVSDAVEASALVAVSVALAEMLDSVDTLELLAGPEVVALMALDSVDAEMAVELDTLAELDTLVELELAELDVVTAQPASRNKDVSAPATAPRLRNMAGDPYDRNSHICPDRTKRPLGYARVGPLLAGSAPGGVAALAGDAAVMR